MPMQGPVSISKTKVLSDRGTNHRSILFVHNRMVRYLGRTVPYAYWKIPAGSVNGCFKLMVNFVSDVDGSIYRVWRSYMWRTFDKWATRWFSTWLWTHGHLVVHADGGHCQHKRLLNCRTHISLHKQGQIHNLKKDVNIKLYIPQN